jgi:hypothetical protein
MSVVDHVSGRGPHSVFSYYNAASPVVYWNRVNVHWHIRISATSLHFEITQRYPVLISTTWEVHTYRIHAWFGNSAYHNVPPNEDLVLGFKNIPVVGVVEEQRSDERCLVNDVLVEESVPDRQMFVALLYRVPYDVLDIFREEVRFTFWCRFA